jgi:hypothetical protein
MNRVLSKMDLDSLQKDQPAQTLGGPEPDAGQFLRPRPGVNCTEFECPKEEPQEQQS